MVHNQNFHVHVRMWKISQIQTNDQRSSRIGCWKSTWSIWMSFYVAKPFLKQVRARYYGEQHETLSSGYIFWVHEQAVDFYCIDFYNQPDNLHSRIHVSHVRTDRNDSLKTQIIFQSHVSIYLEICPSKITNTFPSSLPIGYTNKSSKFLISILAENLQSSAKWSVRASSST